MLDGCYIEGVRALARAQISRKTLRSLRPEIGQFAGRAGEDRAVEDRAGEDMAGQGRAGGHIKSGQSKSRAGRGQKAGHDVHCAI